MSIVLCDRCEKPIDTDKDADSYIYQTEEWVCENCREANDEQLMEGYVNE